MKAHAVRPTPREVVASCQQDAEMNECSTRPYLEAAISRVYLAHEVELARLRGALEATAETLGDIVCHDEDGCGFMTYQDDEERADTSGFGCAQCDTWRLAHHAAHSALATCPPGDTLKQVVEMLRKMSGAHSPDCAVAVNVRHGCTCHVELRADALRLLGEGPADLPECLRPASPEKIQEAMKGFTSETIREALERGRQDRDAFEATQRNELPPDNLRFK